MVQLQPRIHGGARKTVLSYAGGLARTSQRSEPGARRLAPGTSCPAAPSVLLVLGGAGSEVPQSPAGSPRARKGRGRRPPLASAPPGPPPPPWTPSRDGGAGERFSHVTEAPAPGPMRTRGRGFRGRRAGREPRAPAAAGETRSRAAGRWGGARRGPDAGLSSVGGQARPRRRQQHEVSGHGRQRER